MRHVCLVEMEKQRKASNSACDSEEVSGERVLVFLEQHQTVE